LHHRAVTDYRYRRDDLLFGRLRLLPAISSFLFAVLSTCRQRPDELDGNEEGSRSIIEIDGNKSRAPENHSIATNRNAEISYRVWKIRTCGYFFRAVEYRVSTVEVPIVAAYLDRGT